MEKKQEDIDDNQIEGQTFPSIDTKRLKLLRTLIMYLTFIAVGCSVSILGPTLVDLEKNIKEHRHTMGYAVTARGAGSLCGSLIGGVLFDYFIEIRPLLITFSFIMSVATMAIPFFRSLQGLFFVIFIGGLVTASLNTGVNVFCLRVWRQDMGPYYMGLHFSFGLGGILGTAYASAFQSIEISEGSMRPVTYAYIIISVSALTVAALWASLFICIPRTTERHNIAKRKDIKLPNMQFTMIVICMSALMTFTALSMEMGFAQSLANYAEKKFGLEAYKASLLTNAYWISYSISRFLAIFIAVKVNPTFILPINLTLTTVASIILAALALKDRIFLWIGSIIMGLGLATTFPTVLMCLEHHIEITNKIASVFMITSALAEMVVPNFLINSIEVNEATLFNYMLSGSILLSIFFIITLCFYVREGEKYIDIPPKYSRKRRQSIVAETVEKKPTNVRRLSILYEAK